MIRTTAINKLLSLDTRIRGVPGGTSAGKTYGIIPILIDKAARQPLEISVVSESIPHLRRGALKDFLKIMYETGRFRPAAYNKAHLKYTFVNGSYIEFFSADQSDRLRGARRDILYINECNNVTWDAYLQLAIRTNLEVWLDFNPTHEFWYHTELQEDPDFSEVVLTYQDNEALVDSIRKEIEKARDKAKHSEYWANWWKVYGLGQLGSLEGVVFNNWKIIDTIPEEARFIGQGLDFGYSNDPTAIVDIYKWNEYRVLDEVLYRTGMVNQEIAPYIRGICYADSAEPKSIEEIRRTGKDIKGVTKGRDSINFGVQIMQQQKYLVTARSTNLIKELRTYCWDTDKEGRKVNKPVGGRDHAIDGVRYHEMEDLGLKQEMFFF